MTNVEALCASWLEAKKEETAANAKRLKVEAEMVAAMDVPDEGSKTHKLDGFKVTVTQPITRNIDLDVWAKVSGNCPKALQPVKTKIDADHVGCKYLANNEPEIWKRISAAFETKPGKVGFNVEAV